MKNKKIYVIGGTGGVGKMVVPALDKDKYDTTPISSSTIDVVDANADYSILEDADVVINMSGVMRENLLSKYNDGVVDMIRVNCNGAVNVLANVLPMLKRGGRLIMMSSVFSEMIVPGFGVYSATKSFIDKIVSIAAMEVAHRGITVNSIQLGYTGVGMGAVDNVYLYEKTRNKCALKRFCSPEEIARTIDYIVDTEYLTGQNIRLDGGIK